MVGVGDGKIETETRDKQNKNNNIMKKLNFLKASMIALCGAALTLTSCGGGQSGQGADSTAVKTTDMKKAPYQKKYTNADFYDAQGNFKQDVAKKAFLDMFAYYDVPFTPLMEKDIWFTDFGLGDFENVGMGGIFWINDSTYGYFSHSIYLLPGQMIPEHKHVKTAFPAKQESWMVDKGWVYNFSEVGDPTEGAEDLIPASQKESTVSKNYVKQNLGEVLTLKQPETWHFMMAGPEGAIVWEFANYHDNAGLRFTKPGAAL